MGKGAIIFIWGFTAGLAFGNWANGPLACERGVKAGAWLREVVGKPPINNLSIEEKCHAAR